MSLRAADCARPLIRATKRPGVFFDKETFGEDRLVKGKISAPGFLELAPLGNTLGATFCGSKRIRSTICRGSLQTRRKRVYPR
jgi:hypothetical protein